MTLYDIMNILIAGDFCPQHRVADKFEDGDFESVLGGVRDIVSGADYSIVNFECPVTYGGETPIVKCGPNLQCSEKGMEAVSWAGFDCVTLANNHFLDYSSKGVENTLRACRKYKVDTVGGDRNLQEASAVLYRKIDDSILAIINCCEHEFSIATGSSAGSNPLNPIQQYYAINEARKKADYILVIVHGGHEHFQLPSPRMQETYRFFVDAGADAVINHHQHCYSGYEVYKGKPIFYGLGNFCFDKAGMVNDIWNEGFMVSLQFSPQEISYNIYPYMQCREEACITLLSPAAFDNRLNELNAIISDSNRLKQAIGKYYESSGKGILNFLEPFACRLYNGLRHRGLLPSFISTKRILRATNYICCEAHRDKLESALYIKLNN